MRTWQSIVLENEIFGFFYHVIFIFGLYIYMYMYYEMAKCLL